MASSQFRVTQLSDNSLILHHLITGRKYQVDPSIDNCYKNKILNFDFGYCFDNDSELRISFDIDDDDIYSLLCFEMHDDMDMDIDIADFDTEQLKQIIYALRNKVRTFAQQNDALTEENDTLKEENDALKEENDALKYEIQQNDECDLLSSLDRDLYDNSNCFY